ncbi:MAG: glycosyltransferase family 2 protein [Desulfobacterales bacterium]|nr:glycosyltransferase family 2 protein [Desulfobacterales bacterium]
MGPLISIIIPNHNGAATLGNCLRAALASDYDNFEVVVVDDCSTDSSRKIIAAHPCSLIRLPVRSGAAVARNTGAANSKGEILFFIDADCLLEPDALARAARAVAAHGTNTAIGGTYTLRPFDPGFFSRFQSAFIHYSETKTPDRPDYIASHALVIRSETFKKSSGFPETFMPIIEDVEFSHRLRKNGVRLVMEPKILVRHIFNLNLTASLKNGFRKAHYWTRYSLHNRDLMVDSGTASKELKSAVLTWFISFCLLLIGHLSQEPAWLLPLALIIPATLLLNRGQLIAFYRAGGPGFLFLAASYYFLLYPVPVGIGGLTGIVHYSYRGIS